ncbi:MAG: SAM-dependent methyltransferase, partial [Vicinamibacterales bacterium]
MLELARVTSDDVLFDLGSRDGRIAITAAVRYGAPATGVELNAELIRQSTAAAAEMGVADRTSFLHEDLFAVPLETATVVTLYLLPPANLALRSKLLGELATGARVVSHAFDMGDWSPNEVSPSTGIGCSCGLSTTGRAGIVNRDETAVLPAR